MATKREATVEDLYKIPGKAELVNGKLVLMSPQGDLPGHAALEILVALREYGRQTRRGRAVPDPVAFLVNLPNRRSFCPDAAFYGGPSFGEKFIEGAPIFAVEVRTRREYGPVAEQRMAAKRVDYFGAGTLVVWDVDVLRGELVRVFRTADPENPTTYRRGQTAEAEPALPGWTFDVDLLYPSEDDS